MSTKNQRNRKTDRPGPRGDPIRGGSPDKVSTYDDIEHLLDNDEMETCLLLPDFATLPKITIIKGTFETVLCQLIRKTNLSPDEQESEWIDDGEAFKHKTNEDLKIFTVRRKLLVGES